MNKILLIILINIIIICGYKYKISLYILPFIFIIGSVLYIQLIYIKDKELVEGFNDEDVLSYWNQIEDTADKDIEIVEDNLINKIDSVVKLLTKLETSDNNKYAGQQCEGEFKLIKSHKECGINAYDEYKYVISKRGDNCEYMPGYTYRDKKDLCKIDQECEDEDDCDKGAKCVKNKCKIGFECSSTELDNCNKEDCKKLNNGYGGFSYEFLNGKCTTSRCNVNEYFNCNSKDTCEGLGFNYKWDPKTLPRCQKKEEDVKTCSEIDCPKNFFPIISNKDKACRRPANPDEKIDQFSKIVEINGKKYLDRCNTEVCCQPSYKCGQYFDPSTAADPTRCDEYYNKIISTDKPNKECYSKKSSDHEKYDTFDLGSNSSGTIYYVWNDIDSNGNIWSSGEDNTRQESIQQKYCNDRSCRDCIKGVEKAACSNGLPVNSADYDDDLGSSIQCKSCNAGFSLQEKECKQCDEKTYQTKTDFSGSNCTSCTPPSDSNYKDWGCNPKNGSFIGKTCDTGYKSPGCVQCKKGYYPDKPGSCTPCEQGTYSDQPGLSPCIPCPTIENAKPFSNKTGDNTCDPITGNANGSDVEGGVKCINSDYIWSLIYGAGNGRCIFQGCKKGWGTTRDGSVVSCRECAFDEYSDVDYKDSNSNTENDNTKCKKCIRPTLAKDFSTIDRDVNDPINIGDDIGKMYIADPSITDQPDEVLLPLDNDTINYCDATTGSPRIVGEPYLTGGCKDESSPIKWKGNEIRPSGSTKWVIGDECGLPSCSTQVRSIQGSAYHGYIVDMGAACKDIGPQSDTECGPACGADNCNTYLSPYDANGIAHNQNVYTLCKKKSDAEWTTFQPCEASTHTLSECSTRNRYDARPVAQGGCAGVCSG